MAAKRILLVDDDQIVLNSLGEFLRLEGFDVDAAADVQTAIARLERSVYNIVFTDINMPDVSGTELIKVVRERYPDTVVVVITGYGTIEGAVECIRLGAYDYVTKPIVDDEIKLLITRALEQQRLIAENRSLRAQLDGQFRPENILGRDRQMRRVFDLVQAVADTRTTVLITGESGTGKTLVARAIHNHSPRRAQPFVEVSCGALPEGLLESELFGHVRGSFTGATANKTGKFQAADGGTIFLDEISTASPALQVKLLNVLQDTTFQRVGDHESIKVDVRVILATNQDLEREVKAGRFREDLFYRINVVSIALPPLRERMGDIRLLAEHFLDVYRRETGRAVRGFSAEALRLMQAYSWPGNVRELENCVERAVVLAPGNVIEVDDLPARLRDARPGAAATGHDGAPLPLKRALEVPEREIILRALLANNWNRRRTADALQVNRTTLYNKIRKYGLEHKGTS